MQFGLLHLDVMEMHARVERYFTVLRLLANDLAMRLAFGRDIDNEVALYLGLIDFGLIKIIKNVLG